MAASTAGQPFRLLDLPPELVQHIISHLDDRHLTPGALRRLTSTGPAVHPGSSRQPSPQVSLQTDKRKALLALSQTSRVLYTMCAQPIWRATVITYDRTVASTLATLDQFQLILDQAQQRRTPLPVHALFVKGNFTFYHALANSQHGGLEQRHHHHQYRDGRRATGTASLGGMRTGTGVFADDALALGEILTRLGPSLRALYLSELKVQGEVRVSRLLHALASCIRLRTLRVNSCTLTPFPTATTSASSSSAAAAGGDAHANVPELSSVRALQLMHNSDGVYALVDKCPKLESLLVWSFTRRLSPAIERAVVRHLPTLRCLSLDAVYDSSGFAFLSSGIKSLVERGRPPPIGELFLEGHMRPAELDLFLGALAECEHLEHLALYVLREHASVEMLARIADTLPKLKALALLKGDGTSPQRWPTPARETLTATATEAAGPDDLPQQQLQPGGASDVRAYAQQLARLPLLDFFAWDHAPGMPAIGGPNAATAFGILFPAAYMSSDDDDDDDDDDGDELDTDLDDDDEDIDLEDDFDDFLDEMNQSAEDDEDRAGMDVEEALLLAAAEEVEADMDRIEAEHRRPDDDDDDNLSPFGSPEPVIVGDDEWDRRYPPPPQGEEGSDDEDGREGEAPQLSDDDVARMAAYRRDAETRARGGDPELGIAAAEQEPAPPRQREAAGWRLEQQAPWQAIPGAPAGVEGGNDGANAGGPRGSQRELRRQQRRREDHTALEHLLVAHPRLSHAVAIKTDVAHGCKGIHAYLDRSVEPPRKSFAKHTVPDFLIPPSRWLRGLQGFM